MSSDAKMCTKCLTRKPLAEFSKSPTGKLGRKSSCKACDAARYKAQHVPKPRGKRREPLSPEDQKLCRTCGVTKKVADFSLSRKATETTNAVYRSECKPCASTRAMQWFTDNPERSIANKRKFNLAKNYGLTVAQYNAMLREQGGVCAVCGKDEPNEHGRTGKQFRLSVDHCHDTGRVRGLLCQRCNRAIGLLGDDPVLMRRAISYLLRDAKGAVSQGGQ